MKIIVYLSLFLVFQAYAELPTMKAALNNPTLTLLKDLAVGQISNNMPDIHMLDFQQNIVVATIIAKNITMHVMPFTPEQVGINLIEGTNDFVIYGNNMTLNGSMALLIKILFSQYNCSGFMQVNNTGFAAHISVFKNGTRLAVDVKSVNITINKDNVNITIKGSGIQNIMNSLIGFFKNYFFDNIKSTMTKMLPDMISNVTNTILGSLPDDVEVMKDVSAKFIFTEPPKVKNDFLITPILTFVHSTNDPNPPPYDPPVLPDLNETCQKGVQLFIGDTIIRTAVETAHKAGILSFHKELNALGFDIKVDCKSNSTPIVTFKNEIDFKGSSYCLAELQLHGTSYKFSLGFMAEVQASLSEVMKNSTIFFNIEKMTVTSLKIVFGMVIDLKTLISFVNMYLEEVRSVINREIANKGIPLPSFPLFDISDITEGMVDRFISVCGALKPKPKFTEYNYLKNYYFLSVMPEYEQFE